MKYLLAVFLVFVAGCSRNDVRVETGNNQLRITNTSSETLYYVAYPAGLMNAITVNALCNEETMLRAGESKVIPYETLLQTGPDEKAVVYWWRCEEGKDRTTVAKAHLIRVEL